jgi:hypothetical protein
MIKEAYDAGVQQALFDIGITKIAGKVDPGLWSRIAGGAKDYAGRGAEWFGGLHPAAQYGMLGAGGAGLGAGAGALMADDAGQGAMIGGGAGLAAALAGRGAYGLSKSKGLANLLRESGRVKDPSFLREHAMNPTLGFLRGHPGAAAGIGAGLGGAAGLGAGAGINSLMD